MPERTRPWLLCALALVSVVAVAGCGGKSSSGPSKSTVRTKTAADVVAVLSAHNVAHKGSIDCFGQAPGIIDCSGTTTTGTFLTATLSASTSGLSCTGPIVVNVGKTQYSAPNERCS